ncbi:MAG: glycoside hydrolase family 2 protein [Pirellulaceae bacterium]
MSRHLWRNAWFFVLVLVGPAAGAEPLSCGRSLSLNGPWLLTTDPQNVGRENQWFAQPQPDAKSTTVPWIIQEAFPGYHGVAWYWRTFDAPVLPAPEGRYLLRFWAVDYLAEVWLNGVPVGGHEGGETPFVLDVTAAIQPGKPNQLSVRVLNPTHEPIDGIVLNQTARRCKVIPYSAGAGFNHGGIVDSVELLTVPAVYLEDLVVRPSVVQASTRTGLLEVQAVVRNTTSRPVAGTVSWSAAPAASGSTLRRAQQVLTFPPGTTAVDGKLQIDNPHLWDLNDPYLYRVTGRVQVDQSDLFDEPSTRCGFRDFRLADGYFRLNGRRIYLRGAHTCNHYPIGQQFPRDPDLLRRDLLNMKVMGFNMVRFIWGGAARVQLDLCDEIGLLVYEESYASAPIADSPKMIERFDSNVAELIRRDRNHACVVMWGLLNEAPDGPAFRHAVEMLPLVRELDDTRVVMLNSGRYDNTGNSGIGSVSGIDIWPRVAPVEPWVAINRTQQVIRTLGITWPPGQLAFHPGPKDEYSVVRWTAPTDGSVEISTQFTGLAEKATTDVHLLHNGQVLYSGLLNLNELGNVAQHAQSLSVKANDTLDWVVGVGNASYGGDTTAVAATVKYATGETFDAVADFSVQSNPHGVWSYGQLAPGAAPDTRTFLAYRASGPAAAIGSISNPGSAVWEDLLSDQHRYPRVPHTGDVIQSLRNLAEGDKPVFLTEYGIGSAVDLWRAVRHFEQAGASEAEDAQFFRDKLNRFLGDWEQWRLDEVYARPEDFFAESLRKMAGQRTLGLNAIRANPHLVGHSLTGAIDHVMCGEGLTTLFRELKPGTIDAMFDAWAPLRWCLFAEPVHVARGGKIHLEAVLANEDALQPGEYPARIQVIGPDFSPVLERAVMVTVPAPQASLEPPLASPIWAEDVTIDGPPGKYRFLATFQQGAAAAGGDVAFHVTDLAQLPRVESEVVLCGEDPDLAAWLAAHGMRTRPFSLEAPAAREVILVAGQVAPPQEDVFCELARRMARGATVIFLTPDVLRRGDQPVGWLPLANKGTLSAIRGWLYLKDEWSKRHPIFAGLPSGGLMDYDYYRELIPDEVFSGQEPPTEAVAGAIKASQDYASGLMLAVYRVGAGRFILNTLRIREQLSQHPAASQLLVNLLRYAGRDAAQPLAPLPSDFAAQLRALGYTQ